VKAAVWVSLVFACSAPRAHEPTAAQSFEVHLHRAMHVGDPWHVVIDGTSHESSSTYTEQVVVKKSDKADAVHFDAAATARAVDHGVVTRTEYVVAAFDHGHDHRELVPPGKHLVVETVGKKQDAIVEIDGQSASKEIREAVAVVLSLTHGPGDEDTIFGTTARQRVGMSWSTNQEAMKAELLRNGASARDDAIHGLVTLVGVERVGATSCLDLRVDLHVDEFTPLAALPEGSQITKSKVIMKAMFKLPVDTALGLRAAELDVHSEFEAFVPVQSAEVVGVTVDTQTDLHRSETYEPLAPLRP
jgi:hypothetical protein